MMASFRSGLMPLLFGGGYPEVWAAPLSNNVAMRAAVAGFVQKSGIVYAECGGLMYLAETVRTQDGATWPMVGVLPITIVMTDRLQRFGYADVVLTRDCLLGAAGNDCTRTQFPLLAHRQSAGGARLGLQHSGRTSPEARAGGIHPRRRARQLRPPSLFIESRPRHVRLCSTFWRIGRQEGHGRSQELDVLSGRSSGCRRLFETPSRNLGEPVNNRPFTLLLGSTSCGNRPVRRANSLANLTTRPRRLAFCDVSVSNSVVRRRLGAGRGPGSGRPNAHGSDPRTLSAVVGEGQRRVALQ